MAIYSKYANTQCHTFTGNWYGIQSLNTDNTDLLRECGGSEDWHTSLPIHNLMKGCILNDDGTVNYYLKPTDWTKKVDESASKLDGTDGQVMVEIPEHWYLDYMDGEVEKRAIRSDEADGWYHFYKSYVGAYEAVAQRSTKKLCSLINLNADYRGGDNNSAWDAGTNTLLGKCVSKLPMQALPQYVGEDYRTYANNRGEYWFAHTWKVRNAINRFFLIEYATKNSQKAVNAVLDSSGYKQGGLGMGVTTFTIAESTGFNNEFPAIPVGASNSLANGSGEVTYTAPLTPNVDVKVCRYRGIENIFGHVMELIDGVCIEKDFANDRFKVYLFDDPSDFTHTDPTNARFAGYMPEGYKYTTKKLSLNDMVVTEQRDDNDYTKNYCDQAHLNNANLVSNYNHFRTAGYMNSSVDSNSSGLFWIKAEDTFSLTYNYIGTRLNCLPNGY